MPLFRVTPEDKSEDNCMVAALTNTFGSDARSWCDMGLVFPEEFSATILMFLVTDEVLRRDHTAVWDQVRAALRSTADNIAGEGGKTYEQFQNFVRNTLEEYAKLREEASGAA